VSTQIVCDGCGQVGEPTISGRRANGLSGGRPLPDGPFDWCVNCALVAFASVRATTAAGVAAGMTAAAAAYRAAYAENSAIAQRVQL
jgi:hypothetical protein